MAKTRAKINLITERLVSRLEDMNISVWKIILFGSYATGKARPYSDIDIAVISPSFQGKTLLKRQELLGEAAYPLQEPIEPLGYTPGEYKNATPASFLAEIISTGKIIYKG